MEWARGLQVKHTRKCDWKIQKKTCFETKSIILVDGCNEEKLCEIAPTIGRNRNYRGKLKRRMNYDNT